MPNESTPNSAHESRSLLKPVVSPLLLVISYAAFVSLGLPDAVTGVAWPSLRETFEIPNSYFGVILIGLGCGYFVSGLFAGRLVTWLGVGGLLSLSCAAVALAMGANTVAPRWWLFIPQATLWGLGSGGIDAALNAYAASHFPARHMNWLHACYSLGAAIGPVAMTAALVQFDSWRLGYLLVCIAMLCMTIVFIVTRKQWSSGQATLDGGTSQQLENRSADSVQPVTEEQGTAPKAVTMRDVVAEPMVWLHVGLFLCYTGLEALFGQWSFSLLRESRGFDDVHAGTWVGVYFAAIGIGRIVTGAIVPRVGLDRMIRISTASALLGAIVLWSSQHPAITSACLLWIGASLAAIFPCLMSRTPERMGQQIANHAVGFQIAASVLGVACIPGLAGLLVSRWSYEAVTVVGVIDAAALFALHEWVVRRPARASLLMR